MQRKLESIVTSICILSNMTFCHLQKCYQIIVGLNDSVKESFIVKTLFRKGENGGILGSCTFYTHKKGQGEKKKIQLTTEKK